MEKATKEYYRIDFARYKKWCSEKKLNYASPGPVLKYMRALRRRGNAKATLARQFTTIKAGLKRGSKKPLFPEVSAFISRISA